MTVQPEPGRIPEWTIAERLSLARSINGLEKQQLADLVGISRDTVANYESRDWTRKRSRVYVRAWALVCGVDPVWLETGDTGPPGPDWKETGYKSGRTGHLASMEDYVTAA